MSGGGRPVLRVLLERRLPIPLARGAHRPDLWLPALAPSVALRCWYAECPEGFAEYLARYEREVLGASERAAELHGLLAAAGQRSLILQVAERDPARSHAVVVTRRLHELHGLRGLCGSPEPDGLQAWLGLRGSGA
ncbi:DUF488 family protein [Kitasatospora sp. LaBMicrA B282]|uniref:DUF488 family protein, N3 subclade n=1 Tax=Kitasatospora sp. LaBMicrA B282 TaxID=3420949 RepID=UPI003D0A0043